MSEQDNRGNQPDYRVFLVQENKQGSAQWTDVGAGWAGKKGYINLETVAGKVVLKPQAELQQMRSEQQQEQAQAQDHDQTHTQNETQEI